MSEELRSIVPGIAALSLVAAVALILTLARGGIVGSGPQVRAAVRIALVAVLVQGTHFAEELATGFHRRFPELFGFPPMPAGFFVSFNLLWLAIWGLAIWGLTARRSFGLFPLWFLAAASVVNVVAHPLLALRAGGYFPGLVSSPLVGVAGLLLFRHLVRLTGHLGPLPRAADDRPASP
jgi:hypothetical protein